MRGRGRERESEEEGRRREKGRGSGGKSFHQEHPDDGSCFHARHPLSCATLCTLHSTSPALILCLSFASGLAGVGCLIRVAVAMHAQAAQTGVQVETESTLSPRDALMCLSMGCVAVHTGF